MTLRLIGRAVVAGAMLAGAVALVLPADAAAPTIETGTWSIIELVGGLPAPPTVPAGGLWVSSTILGTVAYSAVRFQLPPNQGLPFLSLKVSRVTGLPSTPLGTGQNPIVACQATSTTWKPTGTAVGTWGSAPAYDCSKGVVSGSLSADGSTLRFDLSSMTKPGQLVNLVLVPGTISNPIPALSPIPLPLLPDAPALPLGLTIPNPTAGQLSATFDATFLPLTSAAVKTSTVSVSTPATPSLPAADVPVASAPSPAFSDAPLVSPPPAPIAIPPATVPPATATAPTQQLALTPAPIASHDDTGHRVLAGLLLVALAAWALEMVWSRRAAATAMSLYDLPAPGAARPPSRLKKRS